MAKKRANGDGSIRKRKDGRWEGRYVVGHDPVSGMLGHFSAGFTLDTYAHVTTSAQKEAAKTMGNVLAVE